ncbi:MAG: hypothetical protein GXN91_04340 [Epsilonproteobacteria bacterium]|nr:hypothetical protein [Campylobacterota bacterium]
MKTFIFFLFNSLIFASSINSQNWYNHPKIVEIRKEVNRINKNINQHRYRVQKKGWSDENVGAEAKLYKDKNGNVKKLLIIGGSEDSLIKGEYYYQNKKLIFSYLVSNHYSGCGTTLRNYFFNNKLIFQKKDYGTCTFDKEICKDLNDKNNKCKRRVPFPTIIKTPTEAFKEFYGE